MSIFRQREWRRLAAAYALLAMAFYILLLPLHSISQLAQSLAEGSSVSVETVMCHAVSADLEQTAEKPEAPQKNSGSNCPLCQAGASYAFAVMASATAWCPAPEADLAFAPMISDAAVAKREIIPVSRGPPAAVRFDA